MGNIWLEHLEAMRRKNASNSTEHFEKMLDHCNKWFDESDDRQEKMQIVSLALQLRTSIAMFNKLEEVLEEIKRM